MSELKDMHEAVAHLQRIIEASDYTSSYNKGFVDGLDFCISFISTLLSWSRDGRREETNE